MKSKNESKKDYKSIFPKNPFIISPEHRLTAISCPSCSKGVLYVKYTEEGGNFVCDCGFKLP